MATRQIKVDLLSRVEGEAAFKVKTQGDEVVQAEFRIFEPPRYFEALLRGRSFDEAADITSRICGICPVAYQMSAVHAMEAAFGITVSDEIRALRRLLYCGEWIESHVLHAAMLHAPDYLGFASAFEMAEAGHADLVRAALEIKRTGNRIVALLGGREIHPINVRVGGFWKAPDRQGMADLREELLRARDLAETFVDWTASFEVPDRQRDYTLVALRHPQDYPMNEGRVVSNRGLDIPVDDWPQHFREEQVAHTHALQAWQTNGEAYLLGPMARFALNFEQLSERARSAAGRAGLGPEERNPFRSIVIRAVETLYALDEAIRLIDDYRAPEPVCAEVTPRAATGSAATEAPRGMLVHRYEIGEGGLIETAQIVPPTSQNQPSIEADLTAFLPGILDRSDDEIRHLCEQSIRNYDPCISCATHFLDLDIRRD